MSFLFIQHNRPRPNIASKCVTQVAAVVDPGGREKLSLPFTEKKMQKLTFFTSFGISEQKQAIDLKYFRSSGPPKWEILKKFWH